MSYSLIFPPLRVSKEEEEKKTHQKTINRETFWAPVGTVSPTPFRERMLWRGPWCWWNFQFFSGDRPINTHETETPFAQNTTFATFSSSYLLLLVFFFLSAFLVFLSLLLVAFLLLLLFLFPSSNAVARCVTSIGSASHFALFLSWMIYISTSIYMMNDTNVSCAC